MYVTEIEQIPGTIRANPGCGRSNWLQSLLRAINIDFYEFSWSIDWELSGMDNDAVN